MKTALPSRKELKQTKRKTQAQKYISRKRPTTTKKKKQQKLKTKQTKVKTGYMWGCHTWRQCLGREKNPCKIMKVILLDLGKNLTLM